jgi:hypothetical protein
MVHTCHPKLLGRLRSGESKLQAILGKTKLGDPISQKRKLGIVAYACHPSINGKPKIGGGPNNVYTCE